MLEIIKDSTKVQVDQTGNSGAISMTVECLPSHSFPAGVDRADFKGVTSTRLMNSLY